MAIFRNLFTATLLTGGALFASAQGISVTRDNASFAESFDSMWDGTEATLSLPSGWKVDRNTTTPRQVGSYASASQEVMYTGGISLAANAKNGTWNFGSSTEPTDRAIGGLTTGVDGGTRCISLMTCVKNADDVKLTKLNVSYDIEKYRNGSNSAGFAVQMYTSTDGLSWTAAGDDFYTFFSADSQTIGEANVPISTTTVTDKALLADLAAGESIYLAWNISVASGTTCNNAMGLSIDNVRVTATFADPSATNYNVYIEDLTGWDILGLYAEGDAFGAFPGLTPSGSKAVNGVSYKAFELDKAPVTVKVNNGVYYSLNSFPITEARDYYLRATTAGVTEIADPSAYTGYVNPAIPAFVKSGIYLRGEVNSWGAPADWEFSKEGEGNYALYNKTLSGQFKVADSGWSSSCNYGTNGGNAYPGIPYSLVADTDANCSTGTNTYLAKEIRLTINGDGATLLITTDDDATGLTKVYAVGDFNGWNYMNTDGTLHYDTADGLFHGKITMPRGANDLSHWRVYQKLGMGGAWGLSADATESALTGALVKGSTGNAAVAPGTYNIAFDLATGEYTLEKQPSVMVDMRLNPSNPLLVTNIPAAKKILSLNNSLIDYSDQPDIFNDIATKMGVDASWTRHTNLGKTLDYHWDEGDGLTAAGIPGAKMMVRSEPWTHIILQEQTNRPLVNTDAFRASVKKWVAYIRENCPNPNAIVILPVNWGYSSDLDNFVSNNDKFLEIYQSVAAEEGVVLCPVASAYSVAYNELGALAMKDYMFLDDRHPVDRSAYMAALMEYSLIFGVDPMDITALPSLDKSSPSAGKIAITEEESAKMRHFASAAMNGFSNYIDHVRGTVSFQPVMIDDSYLEYDPEAEVTYTVSGGGSIDSKGVFTSDGTTGEFTVSATCGDFTRKATITVAKAKTEVITYPAIELNEKALSATQDFNAMGTELTLPETWRIDRNLNNPREVGVYGAADQAAMYEGGVSLPSNAKNGTWNFGSSAEPTDRAVGGITTSVSGGARGINIYTHLLNTGKKNLIDAIVSYDVEKYRDGNNAAGFAVQMYYSYDGKNWMSAGDDFKTLFDPSSATAGSATVPMETVTVSHQLPVDLQPALDLYLAWNISVASGSACAGAPALSIDNFSIETKLPEIPEAAHYIYVEDNTGWDALALYAYGDSELFGAWPGQGVAGDTDIDGVTYKVFLFDQTVNHSYNLIFNNWNRGKQTPDFPITEARDYYLKVDADKVTEKTDLSSVEVITEADASVKVSADHVWANGANAIEIYNVAGTRVSSVGNDNCSLSTLPAGLYIVKAIFGSSSVSAKVVK